MSEEISSDDVTEALDRIARTTDGQTLYRYLQKIRLGTTDPAMNESALRDNEGRRRFAADLMAHMGKGIADSDRYAITFTVAKPVATGGGRQSARAYLGAERASWPIDASTGDGGTS